MGLNYELVYNIRRASFCLPMEVHMAMAHNSCTMSTHGLPDMYTHGPVALRCESLTYVCALMCMYDCILENQPY